MRIDLDAKVKTSDGHDAGHVRRVLIDPKTLRITGFVVSTGGLFGHDVIVGEEDFDPEGSTSVDHVVLRLTRAQLEQQPRFEEERFTAPPAAVAATMGYAFPSQAYLWPISTAAEPPLAEPERPAIKSGDVVKDRDGDVVGVVDEIRIDDQTEQLKAIVVRAGAGLERLVGGGQAAEISAEDVLRVVPGEVRIGLDREEIVPLERETRTR
jgi:sporulation protein YlmC with PRC-barrel domain